MNYKIEGAIRKNRKNLIIFFIIWILIAVVLAPAISNSIVCTKQPNSLGLTTFIETFGSSIVNPYMAFGSILSLGGIGTYISTLIPLTIIYSIFFFIGFVKSAPKNEYSDIEHGSSDWSQHGEQYQILSNKKGIILAENNYLPVDKRGNVNVLVVGRIWIW